MKATSSSGLFGVKYLYTMTLNEMQIEMQLLCRTLILLIVLHLFSIHFLNVEQKGKINLHADSF